MASHDSDKNTLLEKAEHNENVSMATKENKDIGQGQPDQENDLKELDIENDKDNVEIKDIALQMKENESEDIAKATKEELDNEKTVLIESDSSSSSSDSEDDSKRVVTMATDRNMEDRIDGMTKRYV